MAESIVFAAQNFELSRTEIFVTEHYVFHYQAGTLAEKEVYRVSLQDIKRLFWTAMDRCTFDSTKLKVILQH